MNPFEEKGRYYKNVKQLREVFSEENYYFECYKLEVVLLVNILQNFKDIVFYYGKYDTSKFDLYVEQIKDLEVSTRHDIVAVQRYVENELSFIIFSYSDDLPDSKEFKDQYLINFVHFGLTSQDIVNTVYTKLISKANEIIRLEFYSLHAFM